MSNNWEKYLNYDASIVHLIGGIKVLGIIEHVDNDNVYLRESEIWCNSKTEDFLRGNCYYSKKDITKITKKKAP